MKNALFFLPLFVLALALVSCNKETKLSATEVEALQARLNADPDVSKARQAFDNHCRVVASFSPEELQAIQAKVKSCGYYYSTATPLELEKCLADHPEKERAIEGRIHLQTYEQTCKELERRYPDLAQMPARQRARMVAQMSDALPEQMLSDYQQKQKK